MMGAKDGISESNIHFFFADKKESMVVFETVVKLIFVHDIIFRFSFKTIWVDIEINNDGERNIQLYK
jgi:hypothetical protein